MTNKELLLKVNGDDRRVNVSAVWESLLFVLRERLGLYATKNACEQGECGSCSVIIDGEVVCSCLVMAAQVQGCDITTLEGLQDDPFTAEVQRAMTAAGGVQCGFCTPGFVVTATVLLREDAGVSAAELREGLVGNLCRCTGYRKIMQAIGTAADTLHKSGPATGADHESGGGAAGTSP